MRHPDAPSSRYSSNADLPIPASPRRTSDPALPRVHIGQQPVQRLALGAPAQHPRPVGPAVDHALADARCRRDPG